MRNFFNDLKIAESAFGTVRKSLFLAMLSAAFFGVSFFAQNDFFNGASISILPLVSFFGAATTVNNFSGKNYLAASFLPIRAKNIAGIIFFAFDAMCLLLLLFFGISSLILGSGILFLDFAARMVLCAAVGYLCICSNANFMLSDIPYSGRTKFSLGMLFYLAFMAVSVLLYIAFETLDKENWFVIIVLIFIVAFLPLLIFLRQKMLKRTLIKMRGKQNGF